MRKGFPSSGNSLNKDSELCESQMFQGLQLVEHLWYITSAQVGVLKVKAAEKGKMLYAMWKGFKIYSVSSGEPLKNCTEGSDMITYPRYKDYSGCMIELWFGWLYSRNRKAS